VKDKGSLTFIKEYCLRAHEVGSVIPSSSYLGRALSKNIGKDGATCRVLEVGPGTGPITVQILDKLKEGYRLE